MKNGYTKGSGISMQSEYWIGIGASPSEYDRKVAADCRRINQKRTPLKMLIQAWGASAKVRHRAVTLPTKPFDFREGS